MADDVSISILYQKLQKLLLVLAEGRVIFPSLKNRVDIAIKELKQILSFLHAENDNNDNNNNSSSNSDSSSSSSHIPLQEAPQLKLLRLLDSAETTIETFLLTTEQRRRKSTVINLIKTPSIAFPIIPPWTQIQFSCKMKKLAQSFRDVSKQLFSDDHPVADKYQILDDPIFTQAPAALEKRQQWHQYDVLVGREDAEKEMVARLTNDNENLCVISLVSEEALGKTALAWNVYNRLDIRQHFQCRAWLHVPIDFEYKDLLLTILKQIPTCVLTDIELMSEDELSAKLFQILMELRFLIALDAVPSLDVWATLARPFADAANGSRVILTTRNSKIASDADPWGHQLKLMCLSDEESWALFSKKLQQSSCSEAYCQL